MRRNLVLGLIVFLFLFFGQTAYVFAADQPKMTFEEVERLIDSSPNKEVRAYFKSVPRGIELKSYDVILRGVHREPGKKVIMFVMSRHIAAGMSGSPAYVDGKLIGAVAYSFSNFTFSSYTWGGISPISLMTEEAELDNQNLGITRTFNYGGMLFKPIIVGNRKIPGLESVSGGKFIVTTSSAGTTTATKAAKPALKAGMPIVVDLVEWTDEKGETTTISAMGTITYIGDDGKVFAFGHPFLNSRKVVYSFRTAEVIGTVDSEYDSFKLSGKSSEVLGAITFDAAYGISGVTSLDELSKLHDFTLQLKREGKSIQRFSIKVADSVLTPLLAQAAFRMIGQTYGAPLPQESSVTQLETRVELDGYEPIVWKELFASEIMRFGPSTIYLSSYDQAFQVFFTRIYGSLFGSRYDFKISNVSVSANFISGRDRILKLGAYKFPNKIIWGENPVLEILFVSQDNSVAIAKSIPIKIEWDKVEKPVYKKDTLNTEKASEKVVWGALVINSAAMFFSTLTNGERQKFLPEYFLGPEDFLDHFSGQLEITNQKIFIRVNVRPKSGLLDETIAQAEDIIPKEAVADNDSEWYVIRGGLAGRKNTVREENVIFFNFDLPQALGGYIFGQNMFESISFEVVLEN